MRVLYLPRGHQLSDQHSISLIPKTVFAHMMEHDPEFFVTWVVAKGTSEAAMDDYRMSMPDPARLVFLESEARQLTRMMQYFMTQELYDQLTQVKAVIPYDVVLNQFLGATPQMATILYNWYKVGRFHVDMPFVNWHLFTLTRDQFDAMPQDFAGLGDLMSESLSAFYGYNVWESQYMYDGHLKTLREWMKPAVIKRVMDNSEVVPNGVNLRNMADVYDRRIERVERGEGPNLFYGGRLAAVKNIRTTFPILDSLRPAANDLIISSNTGPGDSNSKWAKDEFPSTTILTGMDKTKYLGIMAQGDVFLAHSESESYGTGWLEMLAVGMLGVFDDRPWVRALLPDWYPFISGDEEQQRQMAMLLLQEWPDGDLWREYVPKVMSWIQEEHDEKASAIRLWQVLQDQKAASMDRQKAMGTQTYARLAAEAAEKAAVDGVAAQDDVFRMMQGMSETEREWGKRGDLISQMFIRRCLELNGWIDMCDGREVRYRRS